MTAFAFLRPKLSRSSVPCLGRTLIHPLFLLDVMWEKLAHQCLTSHRISELAYPYTCFEKEVLSLDPVFLSIVCVSKTSLLEC